MKTALLAQNEALEAKTLNPNVKKSMLPLSHSVTFPVDVQGAMYPICCVETVPSDSYKISNEILLRQLQPLKVPVMTKYTLNTAYFYCSNRLAWKKWKMFADQADQGRSGIDYSIELPKVANCGQLNSDSTLIKYTLADITSFPRIENVKYSNSLHTYFNVSLNRSVNTNDFDTFIDDSKELPLAFPFFDYQMIVRDYYTNVDRIPDNPDTSSWYDFDDPFSDWAFSNLFPVDDDEIRLKDGVQISSGFHSGDDLQNNFTGFMLDKIRYHDLRYDYFTSSKRAPMRGDAPTVDSTMAVSSVDASAAVRALASDEYASVVGVTSDKKLTAAAAYGDVQTAVPPESGEYAISAVSDVDSTFSSAIQSANLKEALGKIKVNLSVAKKINASELMLMTQLSMWQILNMLHKPYYNDFLNAHFENVRVGDSLAEKPYYIGGTSQIIDINEVLQTSESTSSSKLGSQAAVAHSLSGSYVGSFFAQDYGFIIGIAYIIPDLVYDPAMPRWASRRAIEDYYFPEFANLSMQATLNKELFFSDDDDWNNQPLGYVGAFDELRCIPNYCAGDLLNPSYQDLKAWVLRHSMDNSNKPAINQKFISAKGNVDMTAWTVPNAPKFMLQCANYIEAMRPMPYIAIPVLGGR